jgi:putative (di)nucleoside polyphosphate hydrolase
MIIDRYGFRLNVGMMITNHNQELLWARRVGRDIWQFPQGGLQGQETPQQALFRELHEELGLEPDDVRILGCTQGWLRYYLPQAMIRYDSRPLCIGQRQKWFLLQLTSDEDRVRLNLSSKPEFDSWRWVRYWYPLQQVIAFKRSVYRRALKELAPLVFPEVEVVTAE